MQLREILLEIVKRIYVKGLWFPRKYCGMKDRYLILPAVVSFLPPLKIFLTNISERDSGLHIFYDMQTREGVI